MLQQDESPAVAGLPAAAPTVSAVADQSTSDAHDSTAEKIGNPSSITNEEFLKAIFGDALPQVHVTAFMESPDQLDPNDRGQAARCWGGGWFKHYAGRLKETRNTYFTISVFNPSVEKDGKPGTRRRKALFRSTHCIVVDDVGTKVPLHVVTLPPSWMLETSPGNFQAGYILEGGEPDRKRVEGLVNAMVAKGLAVDGDDPGMKGVTRYVRLPQGSNRKSKYLQQFGISGWKCKLTAWHPARRYSVSDLAAAFQLDDADIAAHADRDHSNASKIGATPHDDPVLNAFSATGRYKHELSDGWHDVTCPWVHEHTDAADNGAAVRVNDDGSYGFKCHHKHGGSLGFRQVVDWFGKEHPELGLGAVVQHAPSPAAPHEFDCIPGASADARHPKALDWLTLPPVPPEVPFVIPGWMPEGAVTLFAAHGGTGKSFMSLFIGLCIATGRHPFADGERIPRKRVILYSAEDDLTVMQSRLLRYLPLLGIEPAELAGWLHILDATETDNALFVADDRAESKGKTTPRYDWLAAEIERFGADVLIFDNASDAMDANENARAKVRQFVTCLKRLAPAVLLLAHVDAASSMAELGNAKGYSGSTGWNNSVRSRWFMARDKSDDIVLSQPKVNYAKAGSRVVIRWSDTDKVFVVVSTQPGGSMARDFRPILLLLLRDAMSRGLSISHSPNACTSAWSTIKNLDGLPPGLNSRQVHAEVQRCIADGLLRIADYKRANRTDAQRLELTPDGLALCEKGGADAEDF